MSRFLFLLGALLPLLGSAASRPRVVVVKSADRVAYGAVVAGFSAEVRGAVEEVTLPESGEAVARTFEQLAATPPALVLAIGPSAAVTAKRMLSEVPLVFSMVPYYEKYSLEGTNITGIAMTSDVSTQLAALKAVAPASRRVGILHDPRYSTEVLEEAQVKASKQGMAIVPIQVEAESQVARALSAARGKIDAMLMVGDKTVATSAVVKAMISFCDAEKLPLMALSPSQVKEGAMLSLSPSPLSIGQQAGRLANRIIHEKISVGALEVAQPGALDLAMNLATARKLGTTCDLTLEVLRFAARQSYPIQVFE